MNRCTSNFTTSKCTYSYNHITSPNQTDNYRKQHHKNCSIFSSSCVCVKSHNWSAKQQLHHQLSVVETSCSNKITQHTYRLKQNTPRTRQQTERVKASRQGPLITGIWNICHETCQTIHSIMLSCSCLWHHQQY